MKKTISFIVPCYNSQEYMHKCINSLLRDGENDIEIIVVDDGSTDKTGAIAQQYAAANADVVKVVSKPNGGHGDAINVGLQHASGVYFKVVDSDDWLDAQAYTVLLQTLRTQAAQTQPVDMVVCNYVYEKEGAKRKKVIRYTNVLPQKQVVGWREVGRFSKGQYLLMHAVIFRTELLRKSGLQLPKHTFYVDNLFVYIPMQWVQTLLYLNVNLYRYYIGRQGQSVQESTMIKRIDQQIFVNKQMIDAVDIGQISSPVLRAYMYHYLEIVTTVTSVMLTLGKTEAHTQKKQQLWAYMRAKRPETHRKLCKSLLGRGMHLRGRLGNMVVLVGYWFAKHKFTFN